MTTHRHRPITLLAFAFASAVAGGCATSPMFQKAAAHVVPHMAADATAYVQADATLGPAEHDRQLSQASALSAAAAAAGDVTTQGVYAAWSAVEPWYRAYLAADAKLTAGERSARAARCDKLDGLIAAEAARPLGASTRPAGG